MILKKTTALLGLLSIVLLLAHLGYSVFAYLTFYYNPAITQVLAVPFMVVTCLHAICGMISVSLRADGGSLDLYPKLNASTIIQRVTAALIFPLLILHINTFRLMQSASEQGAALVVIALIVAELLFFASVIAHVAVSLSKALITLGLLASERAQKTLDRFAYILGGILFVIAACAVVSTQAAMFLAG